MSGAYFAEPEPDSGLASLVLLARFHGLPAEPERIRHGLGLGAGSLDHGALVRAARWLGLKARLVVSTWERLSGGPLPAIACLRDGRHVLVAGLRDDEILIQEAAPAAPRVWPRAEFERLWSGTVLYAARRATRDGAARSFGFGWFWAAILHHRGLLADVLLASVALQLLALAMPILFQVIVDKVLVHHGLATLDVVCFGLLAIVAFETLLGVLRAYVLSHTTSRIDVRLGADLFRHLLRLPLAYFTARRIGDTVARVRELESVRAFLTGSALTLFIDLAFTVVFLAVLTLYSAPLTAIVLGSIPLYVLLGGLVTPVLRARLEEKFTRGAEAQAFLVEAVACIEPIKSAAVEPLQARRWDELLAASVGTSFRALNLANAATQLAALLQKLVSVLVLWLGARLVISNALTVGELIAFNLLSARVAGPILRLAQLWQEFQQACVSVRRLGDVLNAVPEPQHAPGRASLPRLAGGIRFEHVSFSYRPGQVEALHDLCLEIAPGQVVGLVGPSGSGKSTIAKLVQRLYVPGYGRVRIDGHDIALIDPSCLRHQIGVVLQESRLLNRTVRENIALKDPALPLEQVIAAARCAGAHDFIVELPEGYDTLVGEQGASLSGGQRQRIALAQALVSDPRILVLDEATSALDYESEAIIQANMRDICRGRTVIIVAHRLSAVRHADFIAVIERGRLVEQGSHAALLARGGAYARLCSHQRGLIAPCAQRL